MPEKQRYNWRTPLSSVAAFDAFDLTSTFMQIKKIKTNRRGVQTKSGGENWGRRGATFVWHLRVIVPEKFLWTNGLIINFLGSYQKSLFSRRWFRKLCLLSKIMKSKSLPYLFNLIPNSSRLHTTRN